MLKAYAFFHLNLMFSSIEEEARPHVIAKSYWPILHLAETLRIPIGIEASGWTLEEIARIDPSWLAACRRLIGRGLIELIGSGYAQAIGPLMPARAVERNLALGTRVYEKLLGVKPRLALINEQAYSAGLLPHYVDAGFDGFLMDWDMCAHAHPEWPREWRYAPQLASAHGRTLPVVWTSSVIFQKLQRLAHGDMTHDEYMERILSHRHGRTRYLPIYSNDAEVFDFRPGRFHTEAPAGAGESEWLRIERAFAALIETGDVVFVPPSDCLGAPAEEAAWNEVRLETAAFPIPVKKQRKYNISRWAVSGRSDFALNSRCRALTRALAESEDETLWRRLLWLWSSDLRTHITEGRWQSALEALGALEAEVIRSPAPLAPEAADHRSLAPSARRPVIERTDRRLLIRTGSVSLGLDVRKGLAVDALAFGDTGAPPLLGTIRHGTYDDLDFAFDWFSGTLIAEFLGRPKITDLAAVQPTIAQDGANVTVACEIPTPLGPLLKSIRVDGREGRIHWDYRFTWPAQEKATLRLANLTLLPHAFDSSELFIETHNGGFLPDRFRLTGQHFDHGAPVSFMVSANSGHGLTEGIIEFGDDKRRLRLEANPRTQGFLCLVAHRMVKDLPFTRISLSAGEIDETLRPDPSGERRYHLAFTLSSVRA